MALDDTGVDWQSVFDSSGPSGIISDSTDSSGSGFLSSLGSLLPGITNSITSIYKSVSPPKPISVSSGQVVYNPRTGTYTPAVTYPTSAGYSTINPIVWIVLIGIVLAMLMLRR